MEGEDPNTKAEAIIQTLTARGWCIGDADQVKALIIIQSALSDDNDAFALADSVESELINMDLRSIGAKSLPDPNSLRKINHLSGPKILQISSAILISVSSTKGFSDSCNQRLLKLVLTDGHSEITAIEYSHIKSIPNDVVPGTKVRLENKAPVHSCIVLLNPNVITLIGGVVQSLYDEWEMTKKYSGFSRASLRITQETVGDGGPPPFEKMQVQAPFHRRRPQQGGHSDYNASTSKSSVPIDVQTPGNAGKGPLYKQREADRIDDKVKTASLEENTEQNPSHAETRPREVAELAPVQNQAASQKLLQKMSNRNQGEHFKGRKNRGKGKQEEQQVFTLNEWEEKKAGAKPPMRNELPDTSFDEDIARQLQNKLDWEDSHVQTRMPNTVADDIRMKMFSCERDDNRAHELGNGVRGRGKGGGRGRGKGKGRGGRGRGNGKGRF